MDANDARTGGRERRGEFVYVDDCPYATDPATLLGVQVGDTVAVTRVTSPMGGSYETEVLSVGQDEYGIYLGVEYDDHAAGVRWRSYASTVVDMIRVTRRVGGGS